VKLREFFNRKPVRYASWGFFSSMGVYLVVLAGMPIVQEYRGSFAAKEFREYGVLGAYKKRFFDFSFKLQELKNLDVENQELNRKVATLEKEVELVRAGHAEAVAQKSTLTAAEKLQHEAGSELARVSATIAYHAPTNLLPNQLYALAVGYFRKQEYEQAAIILSQLVDLKEDTSYQKAETHLMCAIAWYKLKHFKLAKSYLAQAKYKSQPTDAHYRTALIWEALTAKAEGHQSTAQALITSIISRYPHSEEAAWVNQHIQKGRSPSHEEGEKHEH
jgi:tetratricopeptide (TPR) repeat protein